MNENKINCGPGDYKLQKKENGKLFDFNSSFATFLPSGHYKPLEETLETI
jgi:hypothetical protein